MRTRFLWFCSLSVLLIFGLWFLLDAVDLFERGIKSLFLISLGFILSVPGYVIAVRRRNSWGALLVVWFVGEFFVKVLCVVGVLFFCIHYYHWPVHGSVFAVIMGFLVSYILRSAFLFRLSRGF